MVEEVGGGNGTRVWHESLWERSRLRHGRCFQAVRGWVDQKARSSEESESKWSRWNLSVAEATKIGMGRTTTPIWGHGVWSMDEEDAAECGWWSEVGEGG